MGHAERSHALLGPSGAHRWMECPPSARLEEQFPDSTSEAAREGTLAHLQSDGRIDCMGAGAYPERCRL